MRAARAVATVAWGVRQVLTAAAVLLGVSLLMFTAVRLAPHESGSAMAVTSSGSPPEHALPDPPSWAAEYGAWMAGAVRGDFGRSSALQRGRPVSELLAPAARRSLALSGAALALAVAAASLLAAVGVARPHARWHPVLDGGTRLLSVVPVFLYVYLLVATGNAFLLWAAENHLLALPAWFPYPSRIAVLPWLLTTAVLAVGDGLLMDLYGRFRSEMEHAAEAEHLTGVRLLGMSTPLAVGMGALPGMVSHLSRRLAFVLGSLVVVESAVGWPGLGYLAWRAAAERDLPVLLGVALVMAVAVRVAWLLAEAVSRAVDPRRRRAA